MPHGPFTTHPLPSLSGLRGSGRDQAEHVLRQLTRGDARRIHDIYDVSGSQRTYKRAFREYETLRKRADEYERRKAEMIRWYANARRRGSVLVRQVRETAHRIADVYANFLAFARKLSRRTSFSRTNRMWLVRRVREIHGEVQAAPANDATYMPRNLDRVDVRYSKTLARAEGHRRLSRSVLTFLNHEKQGRRIPHAYVHPNPDRTPPRRFPFDETRARPPTWNSPRSSAPSYLNVSPMPFDRRAVPDPFRRRERGRFV